MNSLYELIGREHDISDVCRELKFWVQHTGASVVGAVDLTCADEAVHEGAQIFERAFTREMLPRLKYGSRVPFRLATPGARYDWGALRVADANFNMAVGSGGHKALVVKINSHVAVDRTDTGLRFGQMKRYGSDSFFCGAMNALLEHANLPFVTELEDLFLSEGLDRLTPLRDATIVDPGQRLLFAAAVNARLQARNAVMDVQEHPSPVPTVYLIQHGVTFNRPGPDSEWVGGFYVLDRRGARPDDRYRGLGDDPSKYRLSEEHGRVVLVDDEVEVTRPVRDHRQLVRDRAPSTAPSEAERSRLMAALAGVREGTLQPHPYTVAALKTALAVVAEVAPVAGALFLFGEGILHIHNAHRLTRAGGGEALEESARRAVEEVRKHADRLPPEEVQRLLDALSKRAQPGAAAGPGTEAPPPLAPDPGSDPASGATSG